MGLRDQCKSIKRFAAGHKAFIEISVGPSLNNSVQLDENTVAYPLGDLGNQQNISFGRRFLNAIGIPNDERFAQAAADEGARFHSLVATVYRNLSDNEFENASKGTSARIARYRALLSLIVADEHVPIVRIKWPLKVTPTAEFLPPRYRGVPSRDNDDPITRDFIKVCATDRYDDEQLHFYINTLQQTYSLKDEVFRIARYFSLLEVMAGSITAQFAKKAGKDAVTRSAIRFMLGYFSEYDIPRFTILPDMDFEFDHIELSGRVRHKLFHGGGPLAPGEVPVALRSGVDLLARKPELITHWLRRDCERELVRWAKHESLGWQAQNGTEFEMPKRDPNYTGRKLVKPLVSSALDRSAPTKSAFAKVTGGDLGIVRLDLEP